MARESSKIRKCKSTGEVWELYKLGICVTKSYEESMKWYRKAAEQGDAETYYNIALLYYNGQGVVQSYEEASKWYRKVAEQGYAGAQFKLCSFL